MTSPDKHLEQRARELWHEAAQRIDPATAGRLRVARRQALDAVQAPARRAVRWLIPTGAFAVIALATMLVWQPLPPPHASTAMQPASSADELDNELPPDADKTDPNLYQNLDFYGWLASAGSHAAAR
ncbi:hypothetical protein LRK24_14820 [Rhodanobacter denitrificans]|uniref:hypothetical protein n=1 Tax=Rhodanobacter denitrificans TaxID=666685 RepID=UPI000260F778|nr:hypothetical protein [Rhodanobacter denitrificans]EIL98813.1 hypothetical protein UUC_16785 [Rhodanobacter denitrificans]UJM89692.1 hypothetical protein LRK24_14820 [Rhodanobacter denitrificans]